MLHPILSGRFITPHPGEMSRLTGLKTAYIQRNRTKTAKTFAQKFKATVVLKGYKTVVVAPDKRLYINNTGNPGMASGGCGDVLTGIIGAFAASGMSSYDASKLGVYVHGLAGDIAAKKKGEISLRAEDLLDNLADALKRLYRDKP